MLTLEKFTFALDENSTENRLYLCTDEKKNKAWNLECHFKDSVYGDETVSPMISINYVKTKKQSPAELKGEKWSVSDMDECDEREDFFYIFACEPMFKYTVKIKDVKDNKALVSCSGSATEDNSEDKPKKVKFSFEEWITVEEMEVNEDFSDENVAEETVSDSGDIVKLIPNGFRDPEELRTALEEAEKLAGFTLPEDLRNFLLETNGAVPETKENHLILPSVKEPLQVHYLYGLIPHKNIHQELMYKVLNMRMFIPEQMVPVASVDRCWLCYSNIEGHKGMLLVDSALNLKCSKRKSFIYKAADTFTEFLTKIVSDKILK